MLGTIGTAQRRPQLLLLLFLLVSFLFFFALISVLLNLKVANVDRGRQVQSADNSM